MPVFETFVAKNLKYLRECLGFTIDQLSNITGVDPLTLWELEKAEDINLTNYDLQDDILRLSDYYLLGIDNIYLDNIERNGLLSATRIRDLKNEQEKGIEIDRKPFRKNLFGYDVLMDNEAHTDIEVGRQILKQIQQIKVINGVYSKNRKEGKIDKIDFFEPPEE